MLFTKNELEILNDMNCYENKEKLAKKEINLDNLNTYTMNDKYWNKSIIDFFIDYMQERIYIMDNGLYIFDNSDDDIDCDRKILLKRIFENYDIKGSEDFELDVKSFKFVDINDKNI